MLEVKNVSLAFTREVLKNVNLQIQPGDRLGIVGESGEGKSSLLKILSGQLAPNQGTLCLDGKELPHASQLLIPQFPHVALINQNYQLDPYHTVLENVREKVLHLPKDQRDRWIEKLLKSFDLYAIAHTKAHLISGGEQQRLAILRAIAPKPRILLLDEPFGHLDRQLRLKISSILGNLSRSENMALVMVSHESEDILAWCDKVCFLRKGKLSPPKPTMSAYYQCVPLKNASLLGPVNVVHCMGEKLVFRPNEWKESQFGIQVEQVACRFLGTHYECTAQTQNKEAITLYAQQPLPEKLTIKIEKSA
jgi:iron(III) transport system ATP-binding protein